MSRRPIRARSAPRLSTRPPSPGITPSRPAPPRCSTLNTAWRAGISSAKPAAMASISAPSAIPMRWWNSSRFPCSRRQRRTIWRIRRAELLRQRQRHPQPHRIVDEGHGQTDAESGRGSPSPPHQLLPAPGRRRVMGFDRAFTRGPNSLQSYDNAGNAVASLLLGSSLPDPCPSSPASGAKLFTPPASSKPTSVSAPALP